MKRNHLSEESLRREEHGGSTYHGKGGGRGKDRLPDIPYVCHTRRDILGGEKTARSAGGAQRTCAKGIRREG